MPSHDGVRLDDDQGAAPVPPRFGQQDPKEAIPRAELRAFDGARPRAELLTERQVLEGDRSVSTADQAD